jgi:hypothetical protein
VRACAAVPWEEARQEGWARIQAAEAPQPCTVEAMCKANWPAQTRPTEAPKCATWRGPAAIRGLVRERPREEAIASPMRPRARTEGTSLKGPQRFGDESESKGAEAPQPRTVEAMCKAK